MDCPKCPGKLETIKIEDISIDKCHICKGLWLDKSKLKRVLNRDAKIITLKNPDLDNVDVDAWEIVEFLKDIDTKSGQCPCCHVVLLREKYKSSKTYVNICPKCEGLWIDGGKIKKLRNNFFMAIRQYLEKAFSGSDAGDSTYSSPSGPSV